MENREIWSHVQLYLSLIYLLATRKQQICPVEAFSLGLTSVVFMESQTFLNIVSVSFFNDTSFCNTVWVFIRIKYFLYLVTEPADAR
jgi:hypothetical protein